MSDLPISPQSGLLLVLASQVDDGDPGRVLERLDTLTGEYLAVADYVPAPGAAPPTTAPTADQLEYIVDLRVLMQATARGLASLRAQYAMRAKAADATVAAKLGAIQNLQSLGPLTSGNIWAGGLSAIGGTGLITAAQAQLKADIPANLVLILALGIVLGIGALEALIWFGSAALSASVQRMQETEDEQTWREIVREKLSVACLAFLGAAADLAQAHGLPVDDADPSTVLKQAFALALPGISVSAVRDHRDSPLRFSLKGGPPTDPKILSQIQGFRKRNSAVRDSLARAEQVDPKTPLADSQKNTAQ